MQEITLSRLDNKFGWGWSCSPTGTDAYSIETPAVPEIAGKLDQIRRYINTDRTFKSIRSGGTFYNTAWFYDGLRIVATWSFCLLEEAEDLPADYGNDEDSYLIWSDKNRAHHDKNDVWGYGWVRGFEKNLDMTPRNERLKIRVVGDPRPADLITQAQAAEISGKSVSAIGEAIAKGRLKAFQNPDAPLRQGRRLVSEAAVRELWPTR